MALSHVLDSEHILEIVMCSKNLPSLYETVHLHDKDYIRDVQPSSPNVFKRYSFEQELQTEILANFEFLRLSNLSTNGS